MDQTIRRILALDEEVEEKLQASELQAKRILSDARRQADAIEQAAGHQTRDAIVETEEQLRSSYEEKSAALREKSDRRIEAVSSQFRTQHDTLLETLFADTLREAEA